MYEIFNKNQIKKLMNDQGQKKMQYQTANSMSEKEVKKS